MMHTKLNTLDDLHPCSSMVESVLSGHKTVDVILGTMSRAAHSIKWPPKPDLGSQHHICFYRVVYRTRETDRGLIKELVPATTGIFHLDPAPSFPSSSMASCLAAVAMGTIFWPQGQGLLSH